MNPFPLSRKAKDPCPQYSHCFSCMKTRQRPPASEPVCCGGVTKCLRKSSSSAFAAWCLWRKCLSSAFTWTKQCLCRGLPSDRCASSSSCASSCWLFGCSCCCVCSHTSRSSPPSTWGAPWAIWLGGDSIRAGLDSHQAGVVLVCQERDFSPQQTSSLSRIKQWHFGMCTINFFNRFYWRSCQSYKPASVFIFSLTMFKKRREM